MYKNKKPKKENEQQKYRPPTHQKTTTTIHTTKHTHTKKQNRYDISANMSSSGVNKTQTKHTTLQKDKIRQFTVFLS